jgi:hypothetical protein
MMEGDAPYQTSTGRSQEAEMYALEKNIQVWG